ncbi:hypothetical protein [Apilactobacillus sp. EABW-1NA]|uniref:hypothetical protein n=1 Tax=Apilactobacillus sp. EABW-1NA TaxID=2984137 RepID=UPI0025B01BE0|nr:hypothetical protein [Apilactobacillus sp. EABW-1NA]MDN2613544.1 hypothetical protein [Apilactobacillus sp. EABW-1NA]
MKSNYYKPVYDLIADKNPIRMCFVWKKINKDEETIQSIDTKVGFNFTVETNEINENVKHMLSDPIHLSVNSLTDSVSYNKLANKLIRFAKNNSIPELDLENIRLKFYLCDLIKGTDEYGNPFISISAIFREFIS